MSPSELLRYLDRIECLPGSLIPTDRQLAAQLNMKASTVNRLVLQLTAEGNIKTVGRKRLRVDSADGSPPKRRTVLALAGVDSLRRALKAAAVGFPFDVEIPDCANLLESRRHLVRLIKSPRDGLIVWPKIDPHLLRVLMAKEVPVVQMGEPPDPQVHNISANMLRALEMALAHLKENGHTEIAYLCMRSGRGENKLLPVYQRIAGADFSKASVGRIGEVQEGRQLELNLKRWLRGKKPLTAVVTRQLNLARSLIGVMKKAKLRVPEDLSVITFGSDPLEEERYKTRVTSFHFSGVAQVSMAYSLMDTLMDARRHRAAAPFHLLLQPQFRDGGTVVSRLSTQQRSEVKTQPVTSWPLDYEERREALRKMNQAAYPFIHTTVALKQEAANLLPVVNRNSQGRRSWLPNHPFAHLPVGPVVMHGIRFEVLNGRTNVHNFLHLAGPRSLPRRKPLPTQAEIPLQSTADYLCFLHACGFAQPETEMGAYRIYYANGQRRSIPLITRGPLATSDSSKANLQDWWPDFPSIRGERFRPYVLTGEDEDPFEYERSLYTLVWKNPLPNRRIEKVAIVLGPETGSHLALFAITRLRQRRAGRRRGRLESGCEP